ncbi:MAG: amidohydrolase family protein [Flavobacteriia bacterium]|nr:amidohydrolase family protein [Flavobacteriia bacterium]
MEESVVSYYLFENATIIVSPTKTIDKGSILIKGNEIIEIGTTITAPANTVVIDCKGKTIVAAFIETYTNVGLPEPSSPEFSFQPQMESSKKGAYYWNEAIHPETDPSLIYTINSKANDELVKMGFGIAVTHVQDGVSRGTGALISLGFTNENEQLIQPNIASYYSFKSGVSNQTYPSSQMGSIALLRQAFYDLQWYAHATKKDLNLSLDALDRQKHLPMIFATDEKWEVLRAAKIGDEFNIPFIIMGSGNEYAAINQIKNLKNHLIIPINFPAPYDVKNPLIIKDIPLADLKNWELAPSNPVILKENKVNFSISSFGNKNEEEFWKNLHKAIARGLSVSDALNALTLEPAKLLKIDHQFGTLEKGKKASFMIYDSNPFSNEAKLLEAWLLGQRKTYHTQPTHDITGKYNMLLNGKQYPFEITNNGGKIQLKLTSIKSNRDEKSGLIRKDTLYPVVFLQLLENDLTLQFNLEDDFFKGSVNLHAKVNSKLGIFEGDGFLPNGKWIQWSAIRNEKLETKTSDKSVQIENFKPNIWFPNMAYGLDSVPQKETIAFINATVWTNEKDSVLNNATVIVTNGIIVFVGEGFHPIPLNAKIIDAKGKYLTSGIIDEHSHIAISKGVNEFGQASSAEVSIGDVLNPDDISIYRQLAGGVTAAQLLHGSANPIGGQSALIKLKWGHSADELLIPNAPKFIKFALGENVKQSNFGDFNTTRFPQTRMGVEQVYYDAFNRALAYQTAWKHFKKLGEGQHSHHIHKDLELEVLSEILNGERFITCHSYVQSEILMLMKVADSMNFKINTFTHILEGYKVADKMAERGIAGSTFADWWAYKYEVNDAIPYNAKMMMDQGVVVAINSDDAEMGRRLNQEAAKSVKYGGMSELDAWKMVTLNPAIILHLDAKMGSVKIGKDADLVLWSENPLSVTAKVEYTIVDGEILYSLEQDEALQAKNEAEKGRIISKMLESTENGEAPKPFVKKRKRFFHCDTEGENGSSEENCH